MTIQDSLEAIRQGTSSTSQDTSSVFMNTNLLSAHESPLGKNVGYSSMYTPALLCGIARAEGRNTLSLRSEALPFYGVDFWNAYELSWLDRYGKPHVGVMEIQVPCQSPCLLESKSLKLYLFSLNQTPFNDLIELTDTLTSDLSIAAQAPVMLRVFPRRREGFSVQPEREGTLLDDLSLPGPFGYKPDVSVLKVGAASDYRRELLFSHVFRSVCPITGQPDWASVFVRYQGRHILAEGLFRYLISFREHAAFHEQCVEKMFVDILAQCHPDKLTVYACFARRGGIDINPFRSNFETSSDVFLGRRLF